MSILDRILGNSPILSRSKQARDEALRASEKHHGDSLERTLQSFRAQMGNAKRSHDHQIETDRQAVVERHDELSREFINDAVPMLRPLLAKFDETGAPVVAREIGATIQQLNARSYDELGSSETMAPHILVIAALPEDASLLGPLENAAVTLLAHTVIRESREGRLLPATLGEFLNRLHSKFNTRVDPDFDEINRTHGCNGLRSRELEALAHKRRGPRADVVSPFGSSANADVEVTIRRGQPGQEPKSIDQRTYHDVLRSEQSREAQRSYEDREAREDATDQRSSSGGVLG